MYENSTANLKSSRNNPFFNNIMKYRKLPRIGDYILYNELITYHDTSGCPCYGQRGIGRVNSIINNLIYLDMYFTPTYIRKVCFQINEFRLGLVKYVTLNDKIYMGKDSGYSHSDLDINHPHPDIFALYCVNNNI